ncbi:hypothetical protein [Leifsonia soli]|uniref:Uncharacterized protein n=1 Tax=Leifsonia soli TaxID=582665 RepID=A0A852SZJ9_9MICO|nr:hypothetical protein [Leifsonia soli]NYD74569.1 hypothetical protein [Leifsonia soli]
MFLEILRALYGLLELAAPNAVSGAILGSRPDKRLRVVLRILGARHLVQAALAMRRPRAAHPIGGVVDLLHSATMLTLALLDHRRRRAATLNAAVAALFAAGELRGTSSRT